VKNLILSISAFSAWKHSDFSSLDLSLLELHGPYSFPSLLPNWNSMIFPGLKSRSSVYHAIFLTFFEKQLGGQDSYQFLSEE
jgi:hypothetical protein